MFNFKLLVFVALASFVYGHRLRKSPYVGILGGDPIDISKAPYMAYFYDDTYGLFCGGSIISEEYVLTAAHCFADYEGGTKVVVGTSLSDGCGDQYEIEKVICHENYDSDEIINDICLIKVAKPIKFGTNVNKIALVDADFELENGTKLEVTGWGQTGPFEDIADKLLQVTVPYVCRSDCEDALDIEELSETDICAGEKGKDTCAGDSGGPLTYKNSILVGITSYGIGFCGKLPGIYTNVKFLLPWINKNINHHGC